MASKQPSRMVENNNNNSSSIVFQEENLPDLLPKQPPPPPPPPPPSNNYLNNLQSEQRYFSNQPSEFRRNVYDNPSIHHHHHHHHRDTHNNNNNPDWNHHDGSTDGSDCDEEDDDDDDVDDDDEERDGDVEAEVEGFVTVNGKNDNSSGSVHSTSDKLRGEKPGNSVQKHHPLLVLKDGNGFRNASNSRGNSSDYQHYLQGRGNNNSNNNQYENQVTLAEPDLYYSQYMQGRERFAHGQKEIGENGCGVSGGKEVCLSVDSGEPLRAILSDPITGALMDDAMILPCGHSFGNGGLQHVIRMKACYTCSQSVTEDSVSPNLSLRSAIEAFRREEELHSSRASKRKRERLEQEKSSCGDLSMYFSRGKGVQFPFAVTDRVIIKGNKRTPLRFVGREAVVTTQCLNGWYVVKTLDNAESVKLQYRSLAKVPDTPSSSNIIMSSSANKTTTTTTNAPPNWL